MGYSGCSICGGDFGAWDLGDHTHRTRDVRIDTKMRVWKTHAGNEVRLLMFKCYPSKEGTLYEYRQCGYCRDEAEGHGLHRNASTHHRAGTGQSPRTSPVDLGRPVTWPAIGRTFCQYCRPFAPVHPRAADAGQKPSRPMASCLVNGVTRSHPYIPGRPRLARNLADPWQHAL